MRIRHAARIENNSFGLFFERIDHPGSGYSFDCDSLGNVDLEDLKHRPCAYQNYLVCLADNQAEFRLPTLVEYNHSYWDSGSIRCQCGHEHELDSGDSVCEVCGQYFNAVGQQLVHPSLWHMGCDD